MYYKGLVEGLLIGFIVGHFFSHFIHALLGVTKKWLQLATNANYCDVVMK